MFKNIFWDFIGKWGSLLVSLIFSVILTRLLSVEEFGIMALAMVIISFAHVFMDLGFQRAIVQQKNVTQTQLSTIFFLNIGIAMVLTLVCYFLAGTLARFYGNPLIEPVFKVISLCFLLNALNLIPYSLIYKELKLKANSKITLVSSLVSGLLGVLLAYKGFGIWSLVVQTLCSSLLILILNSLYIKWLPSAEFNLSSLSTLWKYGSRLFTLGVMETLYTRMDSFIIGKIYSPALLGFYYRAQSMDGYSRQLSTGSIVSALFPYIAKHQDDRKLLGGIYLKYLHIISMLSIGMSGVLFLTGRQLFILIFSKKWEYGGELFQLLTLTGFMFAVSALMVTVISGVGNAKGFLRLEIYKKLMLLPVYIFGFFWGLKGFILCMLGVGIFGVMLNAYFAGREVNASLAIQMKIIYSYVGIAALCCGITYGVVRMLPEMPGIAEIILDTAIFMTGYILLVFAFRLKGIYLLEVLWGKTKALLVKLKNKGSVAA